jgi:hypothetical protein
MKRKTIIEIIAALFILMFVYTAASKILDFRNFKWMLRDVPLISKKFASFVAYGIVSVEILVSVLLFFPRTRKLGLWSSLFLMLIFTVYIGYLSIFVKGLPCTCGGVISSMTWKQHFYFNIIFTLLAALALVLYRMDRLRQNRDEIKNVVFT